MTRTRILIIALVSTLGACAAPTSSGEVSAECAAAAAHLEGCTGLVPDMSRCAPTAASAILTLSCEDLASTPDAKADFLSDVWNAAEWCPDRTWTELYELVPCGQVVGRRSPRDPGMAEPECVAPVGEYQGLADDVPAKRYSDLVEATIADDGTVLERKIQVPRCTARPDRVVIHLNIDHAYAGDLRVVLEHAGVSFRLFDADRRYNRRFEPEAIDVTTAFAHVDAGGDWTLRVVDTARGDVGVLRSWSVEVHAAH